VALLKQLVRGTHLSQREGRGDRHFQLTGGNQAGEFRKDRNIERDLSALRFHPVLLRRGEIDNRVDALWYNAELDRELHVTAAVGIDERVNRGLTQPVGQAVTINHRLDAVCSHPFLVGRTGDADHVRPSPLS
jgi:hypothetical protein